MKKSELGKWHHIRIKEDYARLGGRKATAERGLEAEAGTRNDGECGAVFTYFSL